jgi:hypothetical protein
MLSPEFPMEQRKKRIIRTRAVTHPHIQIPPQADKYNDFLSLSLSLVRKPYNSPLASCPDEKEAKYKRKIIKAPHSEETENPAPCHH